MGTIRLLQLAKSDFLCFRGLFWPSVYAPSVTAELNAKGGLPKFISEVLSSPVELQPKAK